MTCGLPKGKIGVTVELKVNFLSPADGVELIARAKTLRSLADWDLPDNVRLIQPSHNL